MPWIADMPLAGHERRGHFLGLLSLMPGDGHDAHISTFAWFQSARIFSPRPDIITPEKCDVAFQILLPRRSKDVACQRADHAA